MRVAREIDLTSKQSGTTWWASKEEVKSEARLDARGILADRLIKRLSGNLHLHPPYPLSFAHRSLPSSQKWFSRLLVCRISYSGVSDTKEM